MPKLPDKDQITVRWLMDHIPITWWTYIVVGMVTIVGASFTGGRYTSQQLDGDIGKKIAARDQLQSDVQQLQSKLQELSAQRDQLHTEIASLQIEKKVEKMTPAQVKEELKKWSRD